MESFIIETKQLTKKYKGQLAVNNVNLHIKKGSIYGLLGRNGAGKTTLMKMLLGLTPPTSGTFTLFDQTLTGHEKQLYPRIGALIETPGFYPNLTGTENLEIFARLRNLNASHTVKNALETVGLPFRDKKIISGIFPRDETTSRTRQCASSSSAAFDPGRADQRTGSDRNRRNPGFPENALQRSRKDAPCFQSYSVRDRSSCR